MWSFCLTAGKIARRIRRDDEQTTPPEPPPAFKAKVALAPSKASEHWLNWRSSSTFTPIRSQHGMRSWKTGLPIFWGRYGNEQARAVDVKSLHAKIGELTLENDS